MSYYITSMLTNNYRFHGHGSLKYVFSKGDTYRSSHITLRTVPNKMRRQCRVSVVVSKKVHKSAVGRNRIRRRLYEIVRHETENIEGVHDIVLIVTSAEVRTTAPLELYRNVRELFIKSGLYKNTHHSGTIDLKE